jgi:RNA polymerase sigma factor (sigma-70 family)
MRKIKNQKLAQLLTQLRFSPQKHRRKQVEAVERLSAIIEPDQEYPFDFVCFKITGFHPKETGKHELTKGSELLEDLQIFIGKLSGQVASTASKQSQQVFTVEQLAKEFGVSTKTISRWRKRGLVARKFVFQDGAKRLGFLQSTVDTFARKHPDIVAKAKSFRRLTSKQKQQIIKQAKKIAATTNESRYQIIEQVAAKTNKSHETVRCILVDFEKSHPDKPVFRKASGVLTPAQAAELYKLYRQSVPVAELMRRFNRSRSSIYRVVNRRRAKELLAKKIQFIASDEFFQEDFKAEMLKNPPTPATHAQEEAVSEAADAPTVSPQEQMPQPRPLALTRSSLQEYLQALKDTPLLNREQEMQLFRKYNYLKYLACTARNGIKPSQARSTELRGIENYLTEAENIKNVIIEANLRLVVSIASKHTTGGATLLDLISEGNFALLQAVEKFDYTKQVRFATYASWTIAKNFARKVPARTSRADKKRAASLANVQQELRDAAAADAGAIERARRSLTQIIKNELDEREKHVILNHFGLTGSPVRKKTKTLQQIGDELGLSKERIRQIELIALQKLRHCLSSEEFELLTR